MHRSNKAKNMQNSALKWPHRVLTNATNLNARTVCHSPSTHHSTQVVEMIPVIATMSRVLTKVYLILCKILISLEAAGE